MIQASGAGGASVAVLDLETALARDYDALAAATLERYGRLMVSYTMPESSACSPPSSTTMSRPGAACCTSISPRPSH